MKILRKLSEEKGSITMTVVAAMLFFTASILIAYFSLSNQSNDQSKKTRQIADSYKVTNSDLVQKYKDVQDKLDSINKMSYVQVRDLDDYMIAKRTNTIVTDEDDREFVLPAGYKVTNDSTKIENGMVIQDKDENQWVWIPVNSDDLNKMYEEDHIGWKLSEVDINTNYRTPSATLGSRVLTRNLTTSIDYREPDILSGIDNKEEYIKEAGFVETNGQTVSSLEIMASKLKDDYKDMINSVRKNEGFYIGRFELGRSVENKPQVKPGNIMNRVDWYMLYSYCKEFSCKNVQSRMIWGCQWDQVCRFINENGDKVDLDNSQAYGNYSDSTGVTSNNIEFNGKTGENTAWKTNNIYDLAGNCWEWTQEAYSNDKRAYRGRWVFFIWFR